MTKRLRVYLEDEDHARLEAFARARGWTKSRTVRVAIQALSRSPARDPVLELSGDIDGLPRNLSRDFDRYLSEV